MTGNGNDGLVAAGREGEDPRRTLGDEDLRPEVFNSSSSSSSSLEISSRPASSSG